MKLNGKAYDPCIRTALWKLTLWHERGPQGLLNLSMRADINYLPILVNRQYQMLPFPAVALRGNSVREEDVAWDVTIDESRVAEKMNQRKARLSKKKILTA